MDGGGRGLSLLEAWMVVVGFTETGEEAGGFLFKGIGVGGAYEGQGQRRLKGFQRSWGYKRCRSIFVKEVRYQLSAGLSPSLVSHMWESLLVGPALFHSGW